MGKIILSPANQLQFDLRQVDNNTYLAYFGENDTSSEFFLLQEEKPYDNQGALYYVIAVVMLYGFSIILMIGSSVKKSKQDHGINRYMRDIGKIRQLEKRQMKYKTRMFMQQKKIYRLVSEKGDKSQTPTSETLCMENKSDNENDNDNDNVFTFEETPLGSPSLPRRQRQISTVSACTLDSTIAHTGSDLQTSPLEEPPSLAHCAVENSANPCVVAYECEETSPPVVPLSLVPLCSLKHAGHSNCSACASRNMALPNIANMVEDITKTIVAPAAVTEGKSLSRQTSLHIVHEVDED